jgi:hypothetical protein
MSVYCLHSFLIQAQKAKVHGKENKVNKKYIWSINLRLNLIIYTDVVEKIVWW